VDGHLVRRTETNWQEEIITRKIDTRDHTTGLLNVDNVQNLLQSLALYPVTHLKGSVRILPCIQSSGYWRTYEYHRMPMGEFDDLVDRARKEATDPSLKVSLYATVGLPKVC
jgi:hypothetical protein